MSDENKIPLREINKVLKRLGEEVAEEATSIYRPETIDYNSPDVILMKKEATTIFEPGITETIKIIPQQVKKTSGFQQKIKLSPNTILRITPVSHISFEKGIALLDKIIESDEIRDLGKVVFETFTNLRELTTKKNYSGNRLYSEITTALSEMFTTCAFYRVGAGCRETVPTEHLATVDAMVTLKKSKQRGLGWAAIADRIWGAEVEKFAKYMCKNLDEYSTEDHKPNINELVSYVSLVKLVAKDITTKQTLSLGKN